jgi:large subunit ribosomal protein L35
MRSETQQECLRNETRLITKEFMPKLKTHKGAAKRFKKTATGKIKRGKAFKRHILTSKDTKRKRHLDTDTLVSAADAPKVKRMIPY